MREKISMFSLQTFIDDSHIDIPLCVLYELNNHSIYTHQAYVINNSEIVWKLVNRHFSISNKSSDTFLKSNFYICNLIAEIWQPKKCDVSLENETFKDVNPEYKCAYLSRYFLEKLVKYFNSGNTTVLIEFISTSIKDSSLHRNFSRICDYIIQLLVTKDNKFTMQDAYILQFIWTVNNNTTDCEILWKLIKYSSLRNLAEFMSRNPVNSIDWKNFLLIVGIYSLKFVFGAKELKDLIMKQILFALDKSSKDNCFTVALILARQACFNNVASFKTYSDWYASVFGINTVCKTGKNVASFTRLTFLLSNLIKYEPEYALSFHIARSMKVPTGCQSLMHCFKDLCRIQKARIVKNPTIPVYNLEVPVVCLLHHVEQFGEETFIFKDAALCLVLLPWLVGEPKYEKIIDLFINKELIQKSDVTQCEPKIVAAVEGAYDDSEEFFQ
ncbi:hypothetical protein CBL_13201 [Carabus blaptoides fortunei]